MGVFSPSVKPITPLEVLIAEQKANFALTPTITPFTIVLVYPTAVNTPTPTITPIPTITPTPTITPPAWFEDMYVPDYPGIAPIPDREPDYKIDAKISYYYPPYAYKDVKYEINCDKPNGILECEHMASGEEVKYFIGEAIACPEQFPYGTVFQVWDGFYTCRDRGGAIVKIDDNTYWLDILYPVMPYGRFWGELADVKVWLP